MRKELLEIDIVRGLLETPVVVRAFFCVCVCNFINNAPLLGYPWQQSATSLLRTSWWETPLSLGNNETLCPLE